MVDEMAAVAEMATERYWTQFERAPEKFEHSANLFRMMAVVTALQRDFGVAYDVECLRSRRILKTREPFSFTASWMDREEPALPVLFAAVGRRLRYPLKLAAAVSHVYLKWDAPDEQFNIEATSRGFVSHSDEHYRKWPKPMSAQDLAGKYYLTTEKLRVCPQETCSS